MTQQSWDRAMVGAMIAFAVSVGALTLAALLLMAMQEAEAAVHAIEAGAGGVGVTLAVRKGR